MDKCKCGLIRTEENKELFVNRTNSRPNVTLCRECYKIIKKRYYEKNKEKILKKKTDKISENRKEYNKKSNEYYKKNKDKCNKSCSKYKKRKRKEDPLYRLRENMRGVVGRGFRDKNYSKDSGTFEILGCSFDELKKHIESQFEDWMTWDNYGSDKRKKIEPNQTWDIDHIIPLSSGKTKDEIIALNHYTNLQPLCSYKNRFIKKDLI